MPPKGYKRPIAPKPGRVIDTYTADQVDTPYIVHLPEAKATPQRTRPCYEHATLSSERPLTTEQLDAFGRDGWELVSVYVRMDAVHAVFKREVTG